MNLLLCIVYFTAKRFPFFSNTAPHLRSKLLEIESQDQEEKYFDDEEPSSVSPMCSGAESPVLPEPCLDRRVLNDNPAAMSSGACNNITPITGNLVSDSSMSDLDRMHSENLPHVENLSLKGNPPS